MQDALVASDTLSLENQDLSDLRPLMSKLAAMPRLTALNLHGNRLSSLPSDLSALSNLKTLDLTQNMFRSINAILPALKTLPAMTGVSPVHQDSCTLGTCLVSHLLAYATAVSPHTFARSLSPPCSEHAGLRITVSDDEEETLLLALPNLVSLNGVDLGASGPLPRANHAAQPAKSAKPQRAAASAANLPQVTLTKASPSATAVRLARRTRCAPFSRTVRM